MFVNPFIQSANMDCSDESVAIQEYLTQKKDMEKRQKQEYSLDAICAPKKSRKGKPVKREKSPLLDEDSLALRDIGNWSNSELFRVRQLLQREKPRFASIMVEQTGRILPNCQGEYYDILLRWYKLCKQAPALSSHCIVCELGENGWEQIDE